jgi:hypothetical protein
VRNRKLKPNRTVTNDIFKGKESKESRIQSLQNRPHL